MFAGSKAKIRTRVSGWIYVKDQAMRGKLMLAFIDEECVGAGEVSIFRHELRHWEYWMSNEGIRPHKEARMSPTFGFPGAARDFLKSPEGATIKALDLGSGPASTVGTHWSGHTVYLTRVDPLADEYNELLLKHGYLRIPVIVNSQSTRS